MLPLRGGSGYIYLAGDLPKELGTLGPGGIRATLTQDHLAATLSISMANGLLIMAESARAVYPDPDFLREGKNGSADIPAKRQVSLNMFFRAMFRKAVKPIEKEGGLVDGHYPARCVLPLERKIITIVSPSGQRTGGSGFDRGESHAPILTLPPKPSRFGSPNCTFR